VNVPALLRDLNELPQTRLRREIADRARDGRYTLRSSPAPKVELIYDLQAANAYTLAARAAQGRYDAVEGAKR
jgi:hypothetical protein